jgi:hypothetical protein
MGPCAPSRARARTGRRPTKTVPGRSSPGRLRAGHRFRVRCGPATVWPGAARRVSADADGWAAPAVTLTWLLRRCGRVTGVSENNLNSAKLVFEFVAAIAFCSLECSDGVNSGVSVSSGPDRRAGIGPCRHAGPRLHPRACVRVGGAPRVGGRRCERRSTAVRAARPEPPHAPLGRRSCGRSAAVRPIRAAFFPSTGFHHANYCSPA